MDSAPAGSSTSGARKRNPPVSDLSSGQNTPRQTRFRLDDLPNFQSTESLPRPSLGTPEERQVRWSHFDPQFFKNSVDRGLETPPFNKVYRGSFAATPISRSRLASGAATPRADSSINASIPLDIFMSRLQMEADDLEDYGIDETRDGFFDAAFYRMPRKELATGRQRKIRSPFSFYRLAMLQKEGVIRFWNNIRNTKRRYTLMRAVTAYMVAYIICLIPVVQSWLGRYQFIMVIATIVNHAGRSIGAQIEGTVSCLLGASFGIASGVLALKISTISSTSRNHYGVFLAICLLITLPVLGWGRARFARVFQLSISAGFALFFLICREVGPTVSYRKVWDFGIPWAFGIAIAQLVNLTIYPNTGNVQIAFAVHNALNAAIGGLDLPRPATARHRNKMSKETVDMSVAVRDFRSELVLSKVSPEDLVLLRNSLQAVIREFLRLECIAPVFEAAGDDNKGPTGESLPEVKIPMDMDGNSDTDDNGIDEIREAARIRGALNKPCREIINAMRTALEGCDTGLMQLFNQRSFLPTARRGDDIDFLILSDKLSYARSVLEDAHAVWANVHPTDCSYTVIQIFLFTSSLLQSSDQVSKLVEATSTIIQKRKNANWRLWLPDYPWQKLVYRSNAQVRHDRGGTTTAFYFRTMKDIAILMKNIAKKTWSPDDGLGSKKADQPRKRNKTLRYRVWRVLRELQGFEARFALKNTITICLLSLPAWLPQSVTWWDDWGAWWGIVAAWHLMQPRVGGNLNDMVARLTAVLLGSIWGAASFAAGDGNPYVMAVFALIFAVPFMYRFTISSHPRSGLIGCLSFTVVSLTCYNEKDVRPPQEIAYTRGLAFIVGVLASILIGWCLWPFVARHELRKSVANMLINLSIVYRNVVAKYIYHDLDYMPSEDDLITSQIREAKLREGFVRIRELLRMTEHEPRLRERFDPNPYEHLIDSSERFFDHIIDVRQASLYFRISGDKQMAQVMHSSRRDAVAAILMTLWILGGGLKSKHPIPKYLPSAAIARRRLLQRLEDLDMEGYDGSHYEGTDRRIPFTELEALAPLPDILSVAALDGDSGSDEAERRDAKKRSRHERMEKWAHIYQYAYSSILNEIVRELEQLQIYTKAITGELSIGKFD